MREMIGEITVDVSAWPFVRVTYVGTVDDAAFERYVQEQAALLKRKERYVILFDARRSGMPSAKQRQRMASYMRSHQDELRRFCRRGAFVIDSPLVRGALTAILWLQPLPFEHEVFADIEAAEGFLRTQ